MGGLGAWGGGGGGRRWLLTGMRHERYPQPVDPKPGVSASASRFNPFTAPAHTISGLKSAHTRLKTMYFLLL